MKRALITGIMGQDGAYLAKLLLDKGYEVYGAYRRSATMNDWRLRRLDIAQHLHLAPFELLEFSNMVRTIETVRPDELYNLAAQSFVGVSFEQPIFTANVDALGVCRMLEAVRMVHPECRIYQASSSEMFGNTPAPTQNEETPFYPRSPYGVSKAFGHWITVNYRESFNLHASSGILFNHESPLRGIEFVTRKVTATMARMREESDLVLELGNMDAKRDWGFAGDYVYGMWLMLQQDEADDYVLATGRTEPVRKFVALAAEASGFEIEWEGEGVNETGCDRKTGRLLVKVNPKYFRPTEVDVLTGDASKARAKLGWAPTVDLEGLAEMMVEADADVLARGEILA